MRVEGTHVRIKVEAFYYGFQGKQGRSGQKQPDRAILLLFECYTCGTHCCDEKQREIAIFISLGDNANI